MNRTNSSKTAEPLRGAGMLADTLAAGLRRDAGTPLTLQVCERLRGLIVEGALGPGQKLPASRQLAADLALGRNTIVDAYARLAAEGYLEARPGSGSFVAAKVPHYEMPPARRAASPARAAAWPAVLSSRAEAVLGEPSIVTGAAFSTCSPDVTSLRLDIWHRLLGKSWREARLCDTQYAAPGGHPALRCAIADHLRLTRQVRCSPEQVVIVNGAQQGLELCARFLAERGDLAWVENPGYPGARRAFGAAELRMQAIPVDAQGMAPQEAHWTRPPRLIHVTPSHQFPTGVEMSLERRLALLARVAQDDGWIVEDDYDGEFSLGGRPIASLQGMDAADRVIYLGTFSKVLFPALRLGYLVLPPALAERFALAAARLLLEGRQLTQLALARFIEAGHFASHIRRMRRVYAQRRQVLEEVWRRELGEAAPLSGTTTGMHVVAGLPPGLDEPLSEAARARGIVAQSLASLSAGAAPHSGLVLGYGAAHDQEVRDRGTELARLVAARLA
jgi:GntR family transcriptional regulator / MocR family aminotransferase